MSQMTDDMARNVVSNWERNRTRYGLTAWEECQLARKWLSAADALDAQAERIKALEGALRGVVSDWDARGNGLEVFKDDPECPYWSPSAAMVGSEHINRARALLGEK